MIIVVIVIVAALAFFIGLLWPWADYRLKNTKRHHAADAEYVVVWIDGDPCAFTDEAVQVATDRARKLNLK